jgi:SAM-dependent methyltransferase
MMNRGISAELDRLRPQSKDAVEVSGRVHSHRPWRSYATLDYPEFDLCNPPNELPQYDVVLCEQVLEHVRDPWRAALTLHDLARQGGTVIVTTPFLYRVHYAPEDYWRFAPSGMRELLRSAGLTDIRVGAWGNASCVRANFRLPRPYRFWRSLKNDPILPIVVWAIAKRPATTAGM